MGNSWFESVAEAQRRARKRLPESVYKALIAGSEHGVTLRTTWAPSPSWGWPRTWSACPASGICPPR